MGRGFATSSKVRKDADESALKFGKSFVASAADPLGLPSYVAGTVSPAARDAWRETQADGNVLSQVGGSVAAPIGVMGQGLKGLISAAPKTAAGVAALLGLAGDASAAGGEDNSLAKAVKGNPALEALYDQMVEQELASKASIKGVKPESADKSRAAAREEAGKLRQQLISEIQRLNPPRQSLRDAHPELASNWPLVQLGVGALAGAATKGIASRVASGRVGDWARSVAKAEDAMDPSAVRRFLFGAEPNIERFHQQAQKAKSHLDTYDKGSKAARHAGHFVGDVVAPAVTGGVIGLEAELYKHRYNLANAPKDSEEYAEAKRALGDDAWMTYGLSAGAGALGGISGAHMFGSLVPKTEPPVAQTRALLRRYSPDYASDAEALKKSLEAEAGLGQLSRSKPPALPAQTPLQTGTGVGPLAASPALPAPPAGQAVIAPTPVAPPAKAPRNKSKNQTSAVSSRYGSEDTMAGREALDEFLDAGTGIPTKTQVVDSIVARRGADAPLRRTLDRRAAGSLDELTELEKLGVDIYDPVIRKRLLSRIAPGDNSKLLAVPLAVGAGAGLTDEDLPPLDGFASGGAVGGHEPVHVGPLHSKVAGRTDHLPITVVSGSYVVPADIVSALGEGNTNAGMEIVETMFPSVPQRLEFARGGKVPIAAAGGEYVLSPEQVALVGGGDLNAGHAALDDWVRATRANTIKTLSSLPGPAQ